MKNVAREMAPSGVQVNSLGTNFMDFPAFLEASGATDPIFHYDVAATSNCNRCHEFRSPTEFTGPQWSIISTHMRLVGGMPLGILLAAIGRLAIADVAGLVDGNPEVVDPSEARVDPALTIENTE